MKKIITSIKLVLVLTLILGARLSEAQITTGCDYKFTYTISGKTLTFDNTPDVGLTTIGNSIGWTINSTPFATTNDPSYTVTGAGIYVVCMTVVDMSCPNPTMTYCDTIDLTGGGGTVSVSEADLISSINLYPNPSNGVIQVQSKMFPINSIAVYNVLGARVFIDNDFAGKKELNLSNLQNGIYILELKSPAGFVSKKITINN